MLMMIPIDVKIIIWMNMMTMTNEKGVYFFFSMTKMTTMRNDVCLLFLWTWTSSACSFASDLHHNHHGFDPQQSLLSSYYDADDVNGGIGALQRKAGTANIHSRMHQCASPTLLPFEIGYESRWVWYGMTWHGIVLHNWYNGMVWFCGMVWPLIWYVWWANVKCPYQDVHWNRLWIKFLVWYMSCIICHFKWALNQVMP